MIQQRGEDEEGIAGERRDAGARSSFLSSLPASSQIKVRLQQCCLSIHKSGGMVSAERCEERGAKMARVRAFSFTPLDDSRHNSAARPRRAC